MSAAHACSSTKPASGITEGRLESGFIALQLHDKEMVVQLKDILLRRSN